MLFLLLIFIFSFVFSSNANSVIVCNEVRQNGFFSTTTENSSAIARYSFDMSATFNATDSSFPNILEITNFTFSYLKPQKNNFTFQNLSFSFFGNPQKIIDCPLLSAFVIKCTFKFPNGEIIYFLNYGYNESQKVALGPNLYVNDGTFFDGKTAQLWNAASNPTCMTNNSTIDALYFWESCCCTSYTFVQISDSSNDSCEMFETTAAITGPSLTEPINIKANYFVTPDNKFLQINVSLLSSPDAAYIYYVYVGYPFVSYINGSSIARNTSFSLELINDKQYEILFDYNPSANDAVMEFSNMVE